MALLTGPSGLRSHDSTSSGYYQVWSTDGGTPAYLPYGGGHNIVLFYNSSGYGRMVGRVDWTLSISQNHSGSFNFYISKYGGGIQSINNSNGTYANFSYVSNVGGNGNNHGIKWTNGNGNTWGNGTLSFCIRTWSHQTSPVVSGANNTNSSYTSHSNSDTFLKRII